MKTNNKVVKSINDLKQLIKNNHTEYAISLNGGVFSRKTIEYNPKTELFKITNHIDNTHQRLTEKQILDGKVTNIGKAIPLNSLIALID